MRLTGSTSPTPAMRNEKLDEGKLKWSHASKQASTHHGVAFWTSQTNQTCGRLTFMSGWGDFHVWCFLLIWPNGMVTRDTTESRPKCDSRLLYYLSIRQRMITTTECKQPIGVPLWCPNQSRRRQLSHHRQHFFSLRRRWCSLCASDERVHGTKSISRGTTPPAILPPHWRCKGDDVKNLDFPWRALRRRPTRRLTFPYIPVFVI